MAAFSCLFLAQNMPIGSTEMIGFQRRSFESLILRQRFSMTLASMGVQSFFIDCSQTIVQNLVVPFFLRTTSPGSDTRPLTRSCGKKLSIRNTGRRMYGLYLFISVVRSIGFLQWHIYKAVRSIYMTALPVKSSGKTTFRCVVCGCIFIFD
jgi:hypothetical protein